MGVTPGEALKITAPYDVLVHSYASPLEFYHTLKPKTSKHEIPQNCASINFVQTHYDYEVIVLWQFCASWFISWFASP